MHASAHCGHYDIADALLKANADTEIKTQTDGLRYILLSMLAIIKVVARLLESKAYKYSELNGTNEVPLDLACGRGQIACLYTLLKSGTQIDLLMLTQLLLKTSFQ